MKNFTKKNVSLIILLLVGLQCTSTVFAATVGWISGGLAHTATVTGTTTQKREYKFQDEIVYHTKGSATTISIKNGIEIEQACEGLYFPTAYKEHLMEALTVEGLSDTIRYYSFQSYVTIPYNVESGNYIAKVIVFGKEGNWNVARANSSDSAPVTIQGGTFVYAPSYYVETYELR